ncbi:Rossmann-fold NAD(P)-binding domain-containing protein [Streptomyces prasinus]|uniref:hypothetical protein n=1 Tax=Streptomyces prasinus TaxID=67345 RepID=UPI00367E6047
MFTHVGGTSCWAIRVTVLSGAGSVTRPVGQALALTDPAATGFYFVEGGEDASFADIGEAIARRLGLGPVEPWDPGSAAAAWGEGFSRYALGANSRVRATRAHDLGWHPSRPSITSWIEQEMPLP